MSRLIKPYWLMLGAILTGIVAIAITPLLGALYLLVAAAALRGGCNGVSQPLVISTVLRAAEPSVQGKAVGMRGTLNRVASITAPLMMGALAEFVGLEASFYIVGAVAAVLTAMLALHVQRSPTLRAANRTAMDLG